MKPFAQLSSFLILGVALSSCAERTDSGAAHAYWLAHAPAQAPPAAEPLAAAVSSEAPTADDAELEAFQERLHFDCDVGPNPMSTAEMVGYFGALEDCAQRRRRRLLAKLSAAPRKVLTSAPLGVLEEAACTLSDAMEYSGRARTAGTMRPVTWTSCRTTIAKRALYWVEQYLAGSVTTFKGHVQREASAGRRAEREQAKLVDYARALATTAPETAFEDDACPMCVLGDADFRKLVRTQATVQTAAQGLADAACSTWPELETALGGSETCRSELRSSWLVEAGGGYDEPLPQWRWAAPEDEDEDVRLPPPKDPDYASVVVPLYAACEAENPTAQPPVRAACLQRLARERRTAAPSSPDDIVHIEAAWQRFVKLLCVVDVAAVPFTESPLPSYDLPRCQLLQAARGAHLLSRWANRETNELYRHMSARREWANRANAGFARLATLLTEKRAQSALKELAPARHALAHAVCNSWPGLDDTTETCDERLELHLLSYAQYLGALVKAPE
ncbi:MAG TPA: hypothetical protein VHB79_09385 [Polyangiaceae bacterium]|nr:hypothetical protein [Polyangiaceae bacterium]